MLLQSSLRLRYLLGVTEWLLISLMTTGKLLVLKFPLRAGIVSIKQCHLLCSAAWITALVTPVTYLLVDKEDVFFDYRTYVCIYGFSAKIWSWLKPLLSVFLSILPNIVVIVTTVMLLLEAKRIARRGRESLRWQGIITVILTAGVFCLSVIPYTVYLIAAPYVTEEPPGPFHINYFRVAACFLQFNILCNFYIYSLTLTSFRKFLRERSTVVAACLSFRSPDPSINVALSTRV